MKKLLFVVLALVLVLGLSAQAKEIRVLLANHPYGDMLKAAIPEFEQATGIKVNLEQLQESQLTTKLTTEFATGSSSVDVFMTRPLQEAKMFYKNGWFLPLTTYDFSDFPKNALSVVTFGSKTYVVPIVTEWQVLYYRKDLLQKAGLKIADGQQIMLEAREIKSQDEIALLNHAACMVDGAYDLVNRELKPGIRENDVVAMVNDFLYRNGSDDVEAVNAVSGERCNPHPHNFTDRLIRPGDQCFFDILQAFM
ncbi:MAG: extracellular solute-binding protein, partial [Spirochaetaceae bacterium]|nr:extracellular solute-binding protein [Spirochaetaceae bacterium]